MVSNDQDVIDQAKTFTGYDDEFTDSTVQTLVDIGKEEISSWLGDPNFQFYQNTNDADRALFWFTCIGIKVRAGEIGGVTLSIDDMQQRAGSEHVHAFWYNQLMNKLQSAAPDNIRGASSTVIERDEDRTYGYDQPSLGPD